MIGALVTVGSGLAWASFDLTRKHISRDVEPLPLATILALAQLPFFAIAWLVLPQARTLDDGYWLPALVSVGLASAGNLLFLWALRTAPVSLVLPLLALTPMFSAVAAALALGERPSGFQVTGGAFVVLGAIGMARLREPGAANHTTASGPMPTLLMVVVAIVWSVLGVTDKQCLLHASLPLHGALRSLGVGSVLLGVLWLTQRGRPLRAIAERGRSIAIASIVACVAMLLELVALSTVMVSVQESVKRAIGTIAAFAAGRIVFRERITPAKAAAAAMLTAGVVLLHIAER
jgi:drug/metabolite transporter (DMT)-like permease